MVGKLVTMVPLRRQGGCEATALGGYLFGSDKGPVGASIIHHNPKTSHGEPCGATKTEFPNRMNHGYVDFCSSV